MTSKERARLRGLANGIETVLQIGKDGIGENLIHQADITLEARELIKGRVLDGCILSPREAAEALAQATDSEVVQVIGSKFVLYRKKKASKPGQRKKPPLSLRDISPKGGDTRGKDVQRDKKRSADFSGAKTGARNKKRSPAPMGRGTGERASRPNAFRKSRQGVKSGDAAPAQRKAVGPGQRKPLQSGRPESRKPLQANRGGQRKPFNRPGPRKARDGGNRRK